MPASPRARSLGVVLAASVAAALLATWALGESGLPRARREGLAGTATGSVVLEGEWAARLVETLGLAEELPDDPDDRDRFALLCPSGVIERIAAFPEAVPLESTSHPTGSLRVRTPALAPGRYVLAVHGRGAGVWSVGGSTIGVLAPGLLAMDVAREPVRLAGGPTELAVRLAEGARIDRAELIPWTTGCIAPAGGWAAGRPLTFGAKARTMVLALDALARLPRDGEPLRIEAERFEALRRDGARTDRWLGVPASADRWVEAVGPTAEFDYRFALERSGLYTVLARVHGAARQIWSLDETLHASVVAGEEASRFAWSEVTTVWLERGAHTLRARLPRGGGADVVQVIRRRTDDAAFLAALGSLGLEEGAPSERVDTRAARRNLASLEALRRAPGEALSGLASVEGELEDLYRRPLSPILPGDL